MLIQVEVGDIKRVLVCFVLWIGWVGVAVRVWCTATMPTRGATETPHAPTASPSSAQWTQPSRRASATFCHPVWVGARKQPVSSGRAPVQAQPPVQAPVQAQAQAQAQASAPAQAAHRGLGAPSPPPVHRPHLCRASPPRAAARPDQRRVLPRVPGWMPVAPSWTTPRSTP